MAALCAGCASIERHTQSNDNLATLPADPHQTTPPRWIKAVPPYSLSLISKAEVDLASVQSNGDGAITVWERDTYGQIQNPSTDYSFKVGEAHYLFDCAGGTFSILHTNTRKENGDLVRSVPLSDGGLQHRQDIFPHSLISAEAELACGQAKHNWPGDARYTLQIRPEAPADSDRASDLTPENKREIERSVRQLKQTQTADAVSSTSVLVVRPGTSACRAMNLPDGRASTFELCVAQGRWSHDVYTVRMAGHPLIEGTDDDTTQGIDRLLGGTAVNLKCAPVNRLASDVTAKTIEDAIAYLKTSSPKASFEQRKDFALSMHSVEIGRHCTLSQSGGTTATLDVRFLE